MQSGGQKKSVRRALSRKTAVELWMQGNALWKALWMQSRNQQKGVEKNIVIDELDRPSQWRSPAALRTQGKVDPLLCQATAVNMAMAMATALPVGTAMIPKRSTAFSLWREALMRMMTRSNTLRGPKSGIAWIGALRT